MSDYIKYSWVYCLEKYPSGTVSAGGKLYNISIYSIYHRVIITKWIYTNHNVKPFDLEDIVTRYCSSRSDTWDGCDYVNHYWPNNRFEQDEYSCPSDFDPESPDCPFAEGFRELLELLDIPVDDYYEVL